MDSTFQNAWKELTKLIYNYEGSLGSRLHTCGKNKYLAYAQWPSQNTWQNAGSRLPQKADEVRKVMRECCDRIETLHKLEVVEDMLETSLFEDLL